MNNVEKKKKLKRVHVTMPGNLLKAVLINSILKKRTKDESITSFLKIDFQKPDGLRELEEECNINVLNGLKKKNNDLEVNFYIDSDVRNEVSKRAAEFGISESEYICKATIDCTTLTMIEYRLL